VRAEEPSEKRFGGYAPPPPPPAAEADGLWDGLEVQKPLDAGDPITNFAPPSRMDWGPQRKKAKRGGLRRLRELQAQRAEAPVAEHEDEAEPQEQQSA
jgi:hypothetical protein